MVNKVTIKGAGQANAKHYAGEVLSRAKDGTLAPRREADSQRIHMKLPMAVQRQQAINVKKRFINAGSNYWS